MASDDRTVVDSCAENNQPADADRTWTTGPTPWRPGDEPALTPNTIVADRFRIVRFIARGGMGEVYEVKDRVLGNRIALKLLRAEFATHPEAIERIKREIHLAREVTHRNVCRIFDLVHCRVPRIGKPDQEILGLTMELLKGETLAQRLTRTGPMDTEKAAPLVRQMAAALHAAHSVGVVHRDFKSSNVMLVKPPNGGDERVVVTDFGVARPVPDRSDDSAPLTAANVVVGTAEYMAPEQAEGAEVTASSDLYALGVVLFEMVTGARPHTGNTPLAVLMKRAREGPRSPLDMTPDLDPLWDQVITRCLAQNPEDRVPSAAEVAAILTDSTQSQVFDLQDGLTSSSTHERPSRSSLVSWRRFMLPLAFIAAVLVVGLGLKSRNDAEHTTGTPMTNQFTTWTSLEIDPDISPDDEVVAFAANRDGRFEIWTQEINEPHRSVQLTDDGEQNFQPTFSPDGRTIAYASHGRGGIWLLPSVGGEPRRLTDAGSHPAWSPDGRWIAFQSDTTAVLSANAVHAMPPSTLWIIEADGGVPRQLTHPGTPNGGHGAPAWTANGRRLVFTSSDRRWSHLHTVAFDGSDLRPLITDVAVAVDPAVSNDGSSLYYAAVGSDERYGVWRLPIDESTGKATGEPVCILSPGVTGIRHFALTSDDSRLIHTALTTTSNLWSTSLSLRDFEPVGASQALTSSTGRFSRPAFSADGRWIAFDSWRAGSDQDIWIMAAAGGEPQRVTTSPAPDTRANWWPNGSALAFMSQREGKTGLWLRTLDSGELRRLAQLDEDVDWVRLSPDCKLIAYHATREGATNTWIASADGSNARQLTFDREVMGYPNWSPDGRSLAIEMKRGDDDHVAVLDLKNGENTQLTFEPGKSWPYDFSPDGDKVIFARLRNGYWNIWWVSRSTMEQRQLTHFDDLGGYVRYPAWSPTGERIVFERAQTTGDLWVVDGLR